MDPVVFTHMRCRRFEWCAMSIVAGKLYCGTGDTREAAVANHASSLALTADGGGTAYFRRTAYPTDYRDCAMAAE